MELLVKAAYHELFGDSKSPDVKLFTLLKDPATWNSLELNNFRPPLISRAYKDDVEPLLSFINKQLDGENQDKLPRGDYKEFLELAKIFLGGGSQEGLHFPAEPTWSRPSCPLDEQVHLQGGPK